MLKPRGCHIMAATLALLATMPSLASDDASLAAFNTVTLSVAGKTRVRAGADYQVSINASDAVRQRIRVDVEGDTLRVHCVADCGSLRHDGIDITMPSVNAIKLLNGGEVELETGLPAVSALSLSIYNGGGIDASRMEASSVNAEIFNGGHIALSACKQLDVRIRNGGSVQYSGSPAVNTDVINGGNVSQIAKGQSVAACNVPGTNLSTKTSLK